MQAPISYASASVLLARIAALSPERQELLRRLCSRSSAKTGVGELYDALSDSAPGIRGERFLTYAPFDEIVPGFSWILFLGAPEYDPALTTLAVEAQQKMRAALFRKVDFAHCQHVLDIGCGYGADLLALARQHPHLRLNGFTLSAKQAAIAREHARRNGFSERIEISVEDTAAAELPPHRYDLAMGFEVVHHLRDKARLFRNLSGSLRDGALIVLADFISHAQFEIEEERSSSWYCTRAQWVELFSEAHFRVVDAIDVSPEIARFLDDPLYEEHLEELRDLNPDEDVYEAFRTYHRGGELLRSRLASYVLLAARHEPGSNVETLRHFNDLALEALEPYSGIFPHRWQYEIAWQPCPLPLHENGPAPLRSVHPKPQPVVSDASLRAKLDSAAAHYAARALALTPQVLPRHARYAARLREIADTGEIPPATPEFELLTRCGEGLAAVLRGDLDPLELLFPGGSMDSGASLYRYSAAFGPANLALAETVRAAIDDADPTRQLRVLEIGAGTGGSSWHILPLLPSVRTSYLFTDTSPEFQTCAADLARTWPFVQFRVLDIEKPPAAQGLDGKQFDIVVAANVLHATRDLAETLRHVRQLLAPEGMLVLLEGSQPRAWVDLIFGMTGGWWRFADADATRNHPLLSPSQWRERLAAAGFEQVSIAEPSSAETQPFPQAVIAARNPAATGSMPYARTFLLLGDDPATAAALRGAGHICVEAKFTGPYAREGRQTFRLDKQTPQDYQRLLDALGGAAAGIDDVVLLAASGELIEQACYHESCSLLFLTQALLRTFTAAAPRLTVVVQPELTHAPLRGFAKALAIEHPELRSRVIETDSALAFVLERETGGPAHGNEVRWSRGVRYAAQLVPAATVIGEPLTFDPAKAYLISGGLGGLGLCVAGWLAERGAGHIVLMSRTAPGPEVSRQLEQIPARVTVVLGDVADDAFVTQLIARCGNDLPSLGGVIHAAGVVADAPIDHLTPAHFERVMHAKIAGAWNLHRATRDLSLDFFVLFSSVASLTGNSGQANHCAANAFLDALAFWRRDRGLPAQSLNWGAWSAIGAASDRAIADLFHAKGVNSIAPVEGLQLLESAMRSNAPQRGLTAMNWRRFMKQFPMGAPFFFHRVAPAEPGDSQVAQTSGIAEALLKASGADRRRLSVEYARAIVARSLGCPGSAVDINRPLHQLGLDSLMAISIRNRLRTDIGNDVHMVRLMERLTTSALASEIEAWLANAEPASAPSTEEAGTLLADLDNLTEDEMDLLLARLGQSEPDLA